MDICLIGYLSNGASHHGDVVDPSRIERCVNQCLGGKGRDMLMRPHGLQEMRSSVNIFVRPSEQSSRRSPSRRSKKNRSLSR